MKRDSNQLRPQNWAIPLGAVRFYAYTQQTGCNASFRLWQAACNSWNATLRFLGKTEDQDRTLRTLVGSDEGDGTGPLSSQSVYGASPSLGGTNLGVLDVSDGSHGEFNAIVNIENFRSGLLWNLFTSAPEVKAGMRSLGFNAPYL